MITPRHSFNHKILLGLFAGGTLIAAISPQTTAALLFWRTDGTLGTWTSTNWSNPATLTGGTAWTPTSDVEFSANSLVTFATTSIGNLTVDDGVTVTVTPAGTLNGATPAIRTFTIGTGATLDWGGQNVNNNTANGFIKNGAGTWVIGAQTNNYTAGFTLNAGTVTVADKKAFGTAAMTINGGTINSSSGLNYSVTALTIGGDFELAGSGSDTWNAPVGLGAATRTITNTTTGGKRTFAGIISGDPGVGLTFAGAGSGTIYITNASNSFSGPITLNNSEVAFPSDAAVGATTSILIDGGRLTAGDPSGNPVTYTISPTRNIQVGHAGGFISVSSGSVLTYNSPITNKPTENGILNKRGSGTLVLGGASTYTGHTTIANGTLQLAATGSIDTTPNINVGSGGTFDVHLVSGYTVGGAGAQTLTGNTGIILGDLNFGATSTFEASVLLATPATPTLTFSNNLTIDPAATLTLNGTPDNVNNYVLANYTGTLTGAFLFTPPSGYTIDYGTGANSQITLVLGAIVDSAWVTNFDGNWSLPANWTGGVPDSPGATARFTGNTLAAVNVDGAKTVGRILISGATNYTISGSDITLNNTGGTGANMVLSSDQGNQTIDANLVTTAGTLDINVNSGTLTLGGALSGPAAINKAGPGTLLLNGNSPTYTATITLNAGTLGGSGTLGGTLLAGSGAHTIAPSATLAANVTSTLTVAALTTNADTTLAFHLVTPGASSVNDKIAVTSNNGLTLSGGILAITANSTGAASLGYYKAIQYTGAIAGTGIDSITLPAPAGNVVYTLDAAHDPGFIDIHRGFLGDSNDDGTVNFADFVLLSNHYGQSNQGWNGADFNNDHITNFADFVVLSNHYGDSIDGNAFTASSSELAALSAFAAANDIPEPTTLTLLLTAAPLLLRRKKR